MRLIVLDIETYWDSEYSLSKMPIEMYVNHPMFMVHGWGVQELGQDAKWLRHAEFVDWVRAQDWSTIGVIGHNLHFDGYILATRYGVKPKLWIDTLGMARAIYPWLESYSLANLSALFKLGTKKVELLNSTKGRRDLSLPEWGALGGYCRMDCSLTALLFEQVRDVFPRSEYRLSDLTLRMFTEPTLEFDVPRLKVFLFSHQKKLRELVEAARVDKTIIQSNPKFAEALISLNVVPPKKRSKTTGKFTYAFAKTDVGLLQLLEHEDPRVSALVSARIGTKSSIIGSRTERFIQMGTINRKVPIHLNYWGARTTGRHAGGGGTNFQNLPRKGDGRELRYCLRAPAGHKVIVGDSSNIELRMVMKLAGQLDVIAKLRNKEDLYCDFATRLYGRPITKADTDERFVGKVSMLSLQYGAGDERFHEMLVQSGVKVDLPEAGRIKDLYRQVYTSVCRLWGYCGDDVLKAITNKLICTPVDVNGWFLTTPDGFGLPGELGVQYADLKFNRTDNTYSYVSGKMGRVKIYGAKVVENLCQHAARHVIAHQALLFSTKYKLANMVHDELVAVVRQEQADECAAFMQACLETPPDWCVDVPLAGEVHVGDSYGDAK